MAGGIQAWQGLTAGGPPEGGLAYFSAGTSAADMAALAWALEENTRHFYTSLSAVRSGSEEGDLFMKLVEAEEHHKQTLESVHKNLSDEKVDRFYRSQGTAILEGGMSMEKALSWAEDKPARNILSESMGMEANAYDRYLKMADISEGQDSRDVFLAIAREEKGHLRKLGELLDLEVERAE
jgi:rubrerythrin